MKRLSLLYAPAACCAVLAVLFAALGRSTPLVVAGCCALAVAMIGHTYQIVHDRNGRNGRKARTH